MPILSFIFFDILYLLVSFLIFILIVKCYDFFYYTALVEMFSIYMHSKESVLGVICDTIISYHAISNTQKLGRL